MAKLFLFATLLCSAQAFAVESVNLEARSLVRNASQCQVKATFLFPSVDRESYVAKGIAGKEDFVWWNLNISSSEGANCPANATAKIRVRGAGYTGTSQDPKIQYPIQFSEPAKNSAIRAVLTFVRGRYSLLNRDYEEWILESYEAE